MSELILPPAFPVNEQRIIRRAMRLLEKYQRQPGEQFLDTSCTKSWLQLHLGRQEREVLSCSISITSIVCWNMKRYSLARLTTPKFIPVKL